MIPNISLGQDLHKHSIHTEGGGQREGGEGEGKGRRRESGRERMGGQS